ncbi:FixH family protein [Brevibacillus sp. MCWH]|uniref:FixH family protein n=1 Tax=Brevibacillus sp. MCWH TaxID=2508871 RepID=UPI001491EC13|nr:FixH family protein [Brevibacillus sp. MCWH]NNV02515.1 hypothetical protein [Brevibacillus sp. MCWH]
MKRYIAALIGALALMAAGCGGQEEAVPSASPVEVVLALTPKEPVAGEAITFAVTVTQDGAPVNDASSVEFELWKDGQEQHATIPGTLAKDGVYTAQTSFAEPGSYYVMYHVTARDFHNMQKHPFTVKAAGSDQPTSQPENHDAAVHNDHGSGQAVNHGHGGEHGADHQHTSGINYHFQAADTLTANETAALTVSLTKDNQPLSKAAVRFEYWHAGEERHQFVDAAETQPGVYSASVTLPASGDYTVNVHVEKDETIHDHKEYTLHVR